jgi:hypothetical protein
MNLSNKTLINVDIQPEYEKSIGFDVEDWTSMLNRNFMDVSNNVFLYNGRETLGMVSKDTYTYWLYDHGLTEEVINGSIFYDKGYAFFRYCMDSSIDEDSVANFVRFMYENDIRDSRDMTREMWAKYLRQYRRMDKKEVYDLLKVSGDCVYIPDLMDFIKRYSNIVVTGGGINECLKEVEIALKALGKSYEVYSKFTY